MKLTNGSILLVSKHDFIHRRYRLNRISLGALIVEGTSRKCISHHIQLTNDVSDVESIPLDS